MRKIGRRSFIGGSVGAALAFPALAAELTVAPSDKIVLGLIGCGGRGTQLLQWLTQIPEVEIACLCDVNERQFDRAVELVESRQEKSPKIEKDFRCLLEDKSIDAVVNATPEHWHAVITVLACQAGKDVYVEKPLAITVWESWKCVEAARKYQRVVQVGTQTRSSAYVQQAKDYIAAGGLGEVHLVRVLNMTPYPAEPKGPEQPVPAGLDWDIWCGPSPLTSYSPGRWFFNRWDYGPGGIAGEAVHQLDLARLVTGLGYPKSAVQTGGIYFYKDDGREIPDTQVASFEYDGLTLELDGNLWTPYMKKIPNSIRDGDELPDWPFCATRVEIYGSDGFMYLGRQGGGWQSFDKDGLAVRSQSGRQGDMNHLQNFLSCIRTRSRPAADVEEGHISSLYCNLANISFRVGSRRLEFDSTTQGFPGDKEAAGYLGRKFREPWTIPDQV
ncbi:MAG TPA: Gfo/Idh/MocA family oxidoreductase [Candidatus Glassbacteria bacterium]|nr:Gfo/Idh/MocA family oxidoreductase [Candidatus Glassbacteria bacterium]